MASANVTINISPEDMRTLHRLEEKLKTLNERLEKRAEQRRQEAREAVRDILLGQQYHMFNGDKEPTYMGVPLTDMSRNELMGVIEDMAQKGYD